MSTKMEALHQQLEQERRLRAVLHGKIDKRDRRLRYIYEHPLESLLRIIYKKYIKKDIEIL